MWVARIDRDGVVIDPDGLQLTAGELSEDLPDLAGAPGIALVGFSAMSGQLEPEVPRIALYALGAGPTMSVGGSCPGTVTVQLEGLGPLAEVVLAGSREAGLFTLGGALCPGTRLSLENPRKLGTFAADIDGRLVLERTPGAAACDLLIQALDVDSCSVTNVGSLPRP